ncbi:MAG: ABC transporter ATP-binding protein [Rubrimonas sp.]
MSVEVAGLAKSYAGTPALRGVSLTVRTGDYCVLLGPSGCGKTTLLNILGGFVSPGAGTVVIGGRDMTHAPAARRPTATVFQDYALFPHMSVLDNVGFGLRMQGQPRRVRDARAADMLALVGLPEAGRRRPHELSGGQRQRVALARALAVEPQVLLLDEPLGALDLALRRAMQAELKRIQRRVGATFVHVTHDQEEAMALADHLVVMNGGRIEDQGPPERLYRAPSTLFSATFLGETNILPATGTGDGVDTPLGPLPIPAPRGEPFWLSIRPEAFGGYHRLGAGRVLSGQFEGARRRLTVAPDAAPDLRLVVFAPAAMEPAERLALTVEPALLALVPR